MSFGISIGDLIKLGEIAARVYKNCRDCTGDYKFLTAEARSLTNLLDDVRDKFEKIPPHKHKQLIDAYERCIDVLFELDKLIVHYNNLDTKSRRAWDRLKWDPEISRSLRERLASSVAMLNSFYTSLIHDNQVLILEALERLESDYKGGYREESIASIERITSYTGQREGGDENDEDDDTAWFQIIRDLEDAGVSHQVALMYRDLVVDWFIKAVNEGRLLEERKEPECLSSRRTSKVTSDMDLLSTSFAAGTLSSEHEHDTEDQSTANPAFDTPLQRTDLSNAPELLHVLSPPPNETSNTFPCELEPMQLLSPSAQAPEALLDIAPQNNIPELVLIPASEAPELLQSLASSDLNWGAQQILAAWTKRDFVAAASLLEEQLTSVEHGALTSTGLQPDRRILRHCIGVCASFCGKLTKAKYFFESAFNGIYLSKHLDDGDISAARWLGDVCLQLGEFHNAVLAWSVALEGSIQRYGLLHDCTRHIAQEVHKMDEWLSVFSNIDSQFLANVDPTDVFSNTHALEKSGLVRATRVKLYELQPRWGQNKGHRPAAFLRPRPRVDWIPGEAFLTGPLVSLGAWPLPWDSTFSPMAVFQTEWYTRFAPPSTALGDSTWLIQTAKAALRELGMEHAEHPDENAIVCRLDREREGFSCSEGIFISFWKLQFRNVFALKISSVKWSTRKPPLINKPQALTDFELPDDTVEFKNAFKALLEVAEAGSNYKAPIGDRASVQSSTRSWASWAASRKTSAST
ncbi:hypothetical protein ST47_g4884 [Ascochyta rabiei]|uniref:Uncharacterized protein n=1 Tax=Didymella rabiei TaxID=5454 RepID=A0A163EXI1_DIDRA|nr:hypothetical protein ST47_g4884 [Ascochyta rabiei]